MYNYYIVHTYIILKISKRERKRGKYIEREMERKRERKRKKDGVIH